MKKLTKAELLATKRYALRMDTMVFVHDRANGLEMPAKDQLRVILEVAATLYLRKIGCDQDEQELLHVFRELFKSPYFT